MKPRRVVVILELETDLPISGLRKADLWRAAWDLSRLRGSMRVLQAQANSVASKKAKQK